MTQKYNRFRLFLPVFAACSVLSAGFSLPAGAETTDPQKYAFVSKSIGNPYFKAMGEGFEQVIEEAGGEAVLCDPANPYADDQIFVLDSLIVQETDAIAIAANDPTRLTPILSAAKDAGISVITVDSDTDPASRAVFCNQAGEKHVAETLMNAVLEAAGGEGAFAIVSTTPDATNQNAWIREMQDLLENDPAYAQLELTEIVYGEDDADVSAEKTTDLLNGHPDLKVLCAPTAAGIPGVAKAVLEAGSAVKVTGLGMPSQMAEYIGKDKPCPAVYLWNPVNLGKLAAYTCLALDNGTISGAAGDVLPADSLPAGSYTVTALPASETGTEILLDELVCFSEDNIDEWKNVF